MPIDPAPLIDDLVTTTAALKAKMSNPTPAPQPAPSPVVIAPWYASLSGVYGEAKTFVLGMAAAAILILTLWRPAPVPPAPTPTPPGPVVPVASDFRSLGKAYRGAIIEARAASWELAATQLAAGVKPDDAFTAADNDFHARRQRDFAGAAAALEAVAPGGSTGHGAELAAAFRDLAKGIRTAP